MSAERDPVIAEALDRLVPALDSDPDALIFRARNTRLRPTVLRVSAVAFAVLALFAGGALAAAKLDVLPWFQSNDRGNASFSIDSTQRYTGPAPAVLECPTAGSGEFKCAVGSPVEKGSRTYLFAQRVEAQRQISRRLLLAQLSLAESRGAISHSDSERLRHDIASVGDDFFTALGELNVETIGGVESAPGRSGYELVPPQGVPMWMQCAQATDGFRCHDLAGSHDVPIGTPVYFLKKSSEWIAVPKQSNTSVDVVRLFHALLGRDLKPAEARLLFDLATVAATASGPTSVATATVATVPTGP